MPEEILPGLFRMEIPLPNSPLKWLNSYLVKGSDRSLIIDTGMNREECKMAMFAELNALGVESDGADIFVTHLHADHLGLAADLAGASSKVYISEPDRPIADSEAWDQRWDIFNHFYVRNGFPEEELRVAMASHPARKYRQVRHLPFTTVEDGDTIEAGGYVFTCVETRGHTPGHMCLYERSRRLLLSGDTILFDITPNITYWPELNDSLRDYLASLEKLSRLDVDHVLPGHRRLLPGHRKRIEELKQHHNARLAESLEALDGRGKTAWEVAPQITWDLAANSWAEFPPQQKWLAVGETIAHLKYLRTEGKVKEKDEGGRVLYALA